MSNTPRYNMDDPAVQDRIRRGSHEYAATEGKHGQYVERAYVRLEYPKMMSDGHTVVGSKEEEKSWLVARPKAKSEAA